MSLLYPLFHLLFLCFNGVYESDRWIILNVMNSWGRSLFVFRPAKVKTESVKIRAISEVENSKLAHLINA